MIRDVTTGGGNKSAVEQASYALGYNLAVEYVAAYEKTWMLEAFQRLNERVFAKEGKTLDWVFLEASTHGRALALSFSLSLCSATTSGAASAPQQCMRARFRGPSAPAHTDPPPRPPPRRLLPPQVHAVGEPMHAELGHKAVTDLVPAEHVAILRKGMHDHDRDMAKFYDRLTELLQ